MLRSPIHLSKEGFIAFGIALLGLISLATMLPEWPFLPNKSGGRLLVANAVESGSRVNPAIVEASIGDELFSSAASRRIAIRQLLRAFLYLGVATYLFTA
jgi:hypothetical protein